MLSSPPRSQPWSPVTVTKMGCHYGNHFARFSGSLSFSLTHYLFLSLSLSFHHCAIMLGIHSQCQARKLLWRHMLFVKYSHKTGTHSSPTCEMSPGQSGRAACPAMVKSCASGYWVMPRPAWLALRVRQVRWHTPRACLSCRSAGVSVWKNARNIYHRKHL